MQQLVLTCAQFPVTFTPDEFKENFLDEVRKTGVTTELGTTKYHELYRQVGPHINLLREYTRTLHAVPAVGGNVRSFHRAHGSRSGGSSQTHS